jgi:hypothetical protein
MAPGSAIIFRRHCPSFPVVAALRNPFEQGFSDSSDRDSLSEHLHSIVVLDWAAPGHALRVFAASFIQWARLRFTLGRAVRVIRYCTSTTNDFRTENL